MYQGESPMSQVESHKQARPRTPLFRAFRRIVDAVEDVVEDVVDRGEGVERDARQLVQNLVQEREEKNDKSEKKA
jgi:hypothetical protein